MADTPYLDSNIVGFNHQDALDVKVDTYRRLAPILNMKDAPAINQNFANVLTNITDGTPSAVDDTIPKISLNEALISTDMTVKQHAIQALKDMTNSNPALKLGVGQGIESPYDQNAKKFMGSDFSYSALRDNEDFYYNNVYMKDPWYVRWPKNVMKFTSRAAVGAATKFAEGFGYLGSMGINTLDEGIKALNGQETTFWADVADNSFSKLMQDADQSFRDRITPVYKQAGFDEKGFFSKLTDWTFWNDSVSDGVAFLASAFIPAGIASKAGWLAKGPGLFGQATKLAKGATALARLATGADTFGEMGLAAFNVANEAAFEAADRFKQGKMELINARQNGENNLTDAQIDAEAGRQAANTFKWNGAVLMFSNAWEMKNIIKPLMGTGKGPVAKASKILMGETGEVSLKESASKFMRALAPTIDRAKFYGKKGLEATLAEGFWEENIQTAIQRAEAGSYTRQGDDGGGTFKTRGGFQGVLEQYAKQTKAAILGNDREVAESIGLGGLIGILGGGASAKFGMRTNPLTNTKSFVLGERRANNLETLSRIAEINNAHNNFMSMQDARNPDGTVDIEKLRSKVAALEHFSQQSEVLEQLKDAKTVDPKDVQVLENKMLNDYVKGLAKVGMIQEAAGRFKAMATKDIAEEGATFISDPVAAASYIEELGQVYDKLQSRNIQDKTPAGMTEAQLEAHNQARRDRAFDLYTERRAMRPVTDHYEAQNNEALAHINDWVQNHMFTGENSKDIGAALSDNIARSRATDYIQQHAKQQFFETMLKDDETPEFVKDFYRAKIAEAKAAKKNIDDFLGDSKPEVDKDGNITFKDETIDFENEGLKDLLSNYSTVYTNSATVENLQQRNEFLAEAILHPKTGMDTWLKYLDYAKEVHEKNQLLQQQKAAQAATPTPVEGENKTETATGTKTEKDTQTGTGTEAGNNKGTETEVTNSNTGTGGDTSTGTGTNTQTGPEEKKVTEEEKKGKDTIDEDGTYTKGTIIVEEGKGTKTDTDKIDPSKAITWSTPLWSSKNDTKPVDANTEQLRDIPYDEMRKDFIATMMADVNDFNSKYRVVMMKDSFGTIYQAPFNNTNEPGFVPQGEVLVVERLDGTKVSVKDVFPDNYKDMADLPIVFSFPRKMFPDMDARAAIYAAKMKGTPGFPTDPAEAMVAARAHYESELAAANTAREALKGPEDKIPVQVLDSTTGIMPTTAVGSVAERFGNDFEVSVALTDTARFNKGAVIVKFKGASFSVGTATLSSSVDDLSNIQKILDMEFDDPQVAKTVRSEYLDRIVYTNENQFFIVTQPEGSEKFKIEFRKVADADKKQSKAYKRVIAKPANAAIGSLRINVDTKALKDGFNRYNPDTKEFENVPAEDYQTLIKSMLLTSFKKTLDAKGNLYMKPINAHFSFRITDARAKPNADEIKATQQKNYDATINKIKTEVDSKTITPARINEIIRGLEVMVKKNQITSGQYERLIDRLVALRTEMEKAPVAPVAPAVVKTMQQKLDEITIPTHETTYTSEKKKGYQDYYITLFSGKIAKVAGIPLGTIDGYEFFITKDYTGYGVYEASTGRNVDYGFKTQKAAKEGINERLASKSNWKEAINEARKTSKLYQIRNEQTQVSAPVEQKATTQQQFNSMEEIDIARENELRAAFGSNLEIVRNNIDTIAERGDKRGVETVEKFDSIMNKYNKITEEFLKREPVKADIIAPVVKTEEIDEEEQARLAKEAKKRKAQEQTTDIAEVVGNSAPQVQITEYKIMMGKDEYLFDQKSGMLKKVLRFGPKVRSMAVNRGDVVYGQILDKASQNFPYTKYPDGTISGFMRTELEGKDQNYVAYGLPTVTGDEMIVDSKGKPVIVTQDEIEVSPVEQVKQNLTDQGVNQLNEFLKRNC